MPLNILPTPPDVERLLGQGTSLHQQGDLAGARRIYEEILRVQPRHFNALHLLGVAAAQAKEPARAVEFITQAIEIEPDVPEAYCNRGNAFLELQRAPEALADYDRALALSPGSVQAYYNRGNAYMGLQRLEESVESFSQAIALDSRHANAYFNRGNALLALKRFDQAVANYDQAIALKPDFAAYTNRANAYIALRRLDEALADFDQAVAIRPNFGPAHLNRGTVLVGLQRPTDALACCDRAIALDPDNAEAHWNRAFALLLLGDYARGWAAHEWRWKWKDFPSPKRPFTQPLWLGQTALAGKTILLHAEQGLGDAIQFCRYAQLVSQLGAKVFLEVPTPLLGLLESLQGVHQLIARGAPLPPFDCHCPLMSLPLAFQTNLAIIPAPMAYLSASAAKLAAWRARLGEKTQPRIGLAWSGSAHHDNDHNRSLPLTELAAQLPPGFDYVSLQKDVRETDLPALQQSSIQHYGEELHDFTDTAALCELMDLVISVDTSIAHLAGALGKKTFVLLPYSPDWRWLLNRDDSPWYSSVSLYRQSADRSWQPVVQRVVKALSLLGQ